MSINARLTELRTLVYEPSEETWARICASLDTWPISAERSIAVDYLNPHLEAWPDALKIASVALTRDLIRTHDQPLAADPRVTLVRHLRCQCGEGDPGHAPRGALRAILARHDFSRLITLEVENLGTDTLGLERARLGRLRTLSLTGWVGDLPKLLDVPSLSRLETLALYSCQPEVGFDDGRPRPWPPLNNLRRLELHHTRLLRRPESRLTDRLRAFTCVESTTGSPILDVGDDDLRGLGADFFVGTTWSSLEHLCIGGDYGPEFFSSLDGHDLSGLKSFTLDGDLPRHIWNLRAPRAWELLDEMTIDYKRRTLTRSVVQVLAGSQAPELATSLVLSGSLGSYAGSRVAVLVEATWSRLERLDLSDNSGFGQWAERLLDPEHFPALRHLDLSNCHLSDSDVERLVSATPPSCFASLTLAENDLAGGYGLGALMSAPFVQRLRTLDLRGIPIPDSDVGDPVTIDAICAWKPRGMHLIHEHPKLQGGFFPNDLEVDEPSEDVSSQGGVVESVKNLWRRLTGGKGTR